MITLVVVSRSSLADLSPVSTPWCVARASGMDDLAPYVSRSPFIHKNGFSRIWHNRTCPVHAPVAWMTNSHPYHLCIYRYPAVQDRIILNIQIWKVNDVAMKRFSIYHTGMCSIWIELLCIPIWPDLLISLLHYLNIIVKSTKVTVHVRYTNQFMSSQTQKLKD